MKLRVNASAEQATPVLERLAHLELAIELGETARDESLVAANAAADKILLPLIAERDALVEQLRPWWSRMSSTLLTGTRKSIELGGCIIGTITGRTKLAFGGGTDKAADKAAVAALQAQRWAKPYLRTTVEVDKTAVKKGLSGKHGDQLKALGFATPAGEEAFFVERVMQEGTAAGPGRS